MAKAKYLTKSNPLVTIPFTLDNSNGTRNTRGIFRYEGKQKPVTLFPKTKAVGGKQKALADSMITRWVLEQRGIKDGTVFITADNNLAETIERYLKIQYLNKKDSSKQSAKRELVHMQKFGTKLSDFTTSMVEHKIDLMKEGAKPKTFKNRLVGAKQFFNWCIDRKLIGENPFRTIDTPSKVELGKKKAGVIWEPDRIEAVESRLEGIYKTAFRVLRYTGLDPSDVFELRVDHIRKTDKNWFIYKKREKGKYGTEMIHQPLSSHILKEILKGIKGKEPDEKVLVFKTEKRYGGGTYRNATRFAQNMYFRIIRAQTDSGYTETKDIKALRHGFATYHAIERRVPKSQLKKWMGHTPSSPMLDEVYIHEESDGNFMD